LENLKEMDNFLDIHDLTKLNKEDIKTLSKSITNKENKAVIKGFPTNENPTKV
jgi:hypothetical protein